LTSRGTTRIVSTVVSITILSWARGRDSRIELEGQVNSTLLDILGGLRLFFRQKSGARQTKDLGRVLLAQVIIKSDGLHTLDDFGGSLRLSSRLSGALSSIGSGISNSGFRILLGVLGLLLNTSDVVSASATTARSAGTFLLGGAVSVLLVLHTSGTTLSLGFLSVLLLASSGVILSSGSATTAILLGDFKICGRGGRRSCSDRGSRLGLGHARDDCTNNHNLRKRAYSSTL
jgi:hypothetical protein